MKKQRSIEKLKKYLFLRAGVLAMRARMVTVLLAVEGNLIDEKFTDKKERQAAFALLVKTFFLCILASIFKKESAKRILESMVTDIAKGKFRFEER